MGAHILAIKDMAGLCRPYAAQKLVKALKEEIGHPDSFPHARHQRHQRRQYPRGRRRRRGRRRCRDRLDERRHQPAESEFASSPRCSTRRATPASTRCAQRVQRLLGSGARILQPVRHRPEPTAPPKSICTRCPAGSTPISRSRPRAWASARAGRRSRSLRGGEPALRRHREGDAVEQGRRRPRHRVRGPRREARRHHQPQGHQVEQGRHQHVRRLARRALLRHGEARRRPTRGRSGTRSPTPSSARAASASRAAPANTRRRSSSTTCAPNSKRSSSTSPPRTTSGATSCIRMSS